MKKIRFLLLAGLLLFLLTSSTVYFAPFNSHDVQVVAAIIDPNQTTSTPATTTKIKPTTSSYFADYNVKELEETFEKRRQILNDGCRRRVHKPQTPLQQLQWAIHVLSVNPSIQNSFYVDEENRVLFCLIPKVASTNLKRLLLFASQVDGEFRSPESIPHDLVHEPFKWPAELSFKPITAYRNRTAQLITIITNYTKVVWVRHPLVRLVSAWNSKLRGNNDFYSETIGKEIIKKFRNHKLAKLAAENNDSSVELFEFFRYLERDIKLYRMSDVHWSLYNVQCLPCYLRPQFIGHLENWYPEADFVLRKITGANPGSYWQRPPAAQQAAASLLYSKKGAQSDVVWRDTLRKLPVKLLERVAQNYKLDFDVFGYNMSIVSS